MRLKHVRLCIALLGLTLAGHAEIVDRIAVSVGNTVITEAQIEEEIRVTAFLNHQPVKIGAEEKRAAAERLVQQTLLRRDMDFSRYPLPGIDEAAKVEADLRATYPGGPGFEEDLKQHGISEEQLRLHLWWQVTTLRFIDFRFRPAVQVPESEVRQYYEKKRSEWARERETIPSLDEVRSGIETILTQQRVDQVVDRWMGDARLQVDIRYRKEAFR